MLSVEKVNQVIKVVVLSIEGESETTSQSLAMSIKRLYFQLTGVEMSEAQVHFVDNKLGNTRALAVYKHLQGLFA